MAVIVPADILGMDPDIDPDRAQLMIDDAVAQGTLVAPCLADEATLSSTQKAQFLAVLRSAVLRWASQGPSGAVVTTNQMGTWGPYQHQESQTVDTTKTRRGLFWPSEIDLLERICQSSRRAGTVDTSPGQPSRYPYPSP